MAGVDAADEKHEHLAVAAHDDVDRADRPRPVLRRGQAPEHREVGGALGGRAEALVGGVDAHGTG